MLQAQVFTIHVPQTPSRIELSVGNGSVRTSAMPAATSVGDWEVTVAFDADRCEISCVYRRIRDVTHWLPPVAVIRFYASPGSQPTNITIDPAGLTLPTATGRALVVPEQTCMPPRRLLGAVLSQGGDEPTPSSTGPLLISSVHEPKVTPPSALPCAFR